MSLQRKPSFIENTLEQEIATYLGVQITDPNGFITALKKQLTEDLQARLQMLVNNFDVVAQNRVNSRGSEQADPSVYLGTGGITYALYQVACLPHECLVLPKSAPTDVKAQNIEEEEEVKSEAAEQQDTIEESELPGESAAISIEQVCEFFQKSLQINKQLIKHDKSGKFENSCASFLMAASIGTSTIEAFEAIRAIKQMPDTSDAEIEARRKNAVQICSLITNKVLNAMEHCLEDYNKPEDEILYGTAGYLQALLLLKQRAEDSVAPIMTTHPDSEKKWRNFEGKVNQGICQISIKLLEQTTIQPSSGIKTMQVMFPRYKRNGSPYVGGAHGTLGVLYMIVMACLMEENCSLTQREGFVEIIANTCEDLLSMQLTSGSFPNQRGFPERDGYLNTVKILFHWCHGAPGAIAPLLAASELFLKIAKDSKPQSEDVAAAAEAQNDNQNLDLARRLYQAAMKAAEATWDNGLLLKGNSTCHGISGNGLLIHSVARWHTKMAQDTEEQLGIASGTFAQVAEQYRIRALMFVRSMSMQSVQQTTENFQDRSRVVVGTPDHPWSLMEGMAGEIYALAALVHPQDLEIARFPAYDSLF